MQPATSSRMALALAAAGVLASACVFVSKIQPLDNDRYVIQARANGFNGGSETTKALKAANAQCARQSKRVVLENMVKRGHAALLGERVRITFACEP